MRRFYETYREEARVTPPVSQLPWSHHLVILEQSKRAEEREFYLRLAIRERWSKRELERQFKAALFERAVLNPPKMTPVVAQMYAEALNIFRDSYSVEFLGLPQARLGVRLACG
jgi:predicted nuclease of restriction endonuclease-like (RecB) superfamily